MADWDQLGKYIKDYISGDDKKREYLEFLRDFQKLTLALQEHHTTIPGLLTDVTGRILELEKELGSDV